MSKPSNGLATSIWSSGKPNPSIHWVKSASSVSLPSTASAPASSALASTATPASVPPKPPSAAPTSGTRLTPAQAFHRFEQACLRLRWKYLDLQASYQRAATPEEYGFPKVDAERNFKVDFHEFYVWIEQAIVLLLLIFGINISRTGYAGSLTHAYHHNVLKALEDEDCPVNSALGRGEVNQALWKAKELRNRWKDAAEGRETPPLKMYDLNWIVTTVLSGLEEAYMLAGQQVQEHLEAQVEKAQAQPGSDNDLGVLGDGDEEWEWMVESMDWEAA